MADTVFVRAQGQVKELTLHSMAMCKPMRLNVYLPPRYGDFSMRYPVVYLLHPWGATQDLRLHEAADHLIHAGALPPFIAVMPQGDKSFFVNAADPGGDFSMIVQFDPDTYRGALEGYGDYGDYIVDDVIPFVEQRFAVRREQSARAIAGVAMGGAGAAALAFSYPDVFGAVGIHSPTLFSQERLGPPWIFGLGDAAAFAQRDPQSLARNLRADDGLRIYLDCGYDDERQVPTANLTTR
jgi:enterochelin esterase-like enzyme